MKQLLVLLMILPTIIFGLTPESEVKVNEAWDAWQLNDLDLVEDNFKSALDLDEANFRAYMGLTLLYKMQGKSLEGWETLEKGLEYTDNKYPYLYSFFPTFIMNNIENTKKSNFVKYIEVVAKEGDPTGELQAVLYNKLAKFYSSKKKLSKARQYVAKTNTISNWMMIGPFENISASGHDTVYPPEESYDPLAEYEGKEKVPTFWFQNTPTDMYVWIDFRKHFGASEAIFYGNSFVFSPMKQSAQIRTGTSGSLKVFLNDENIFEISDENNNSEDSYIVETELQKGWNRLLIKTGFSEINNCNFYARITDASGNPIDGLKYSLENKNYISKPIAPIKVIDHFAFKYFEQQIKKNPEHPENYIMLATAYFMQDKAIEAELILKEVLDVVPNCSLVYYDLAIAYLRGEKEDERITATEKLYELNETIPLGIKYRFNKFITNQEYEKADELIEIMDKHCNRKDYYDSKIRYYAVRKLYDKLISTVEEGYKSDPHNFNFAYLKALLTVETTKQYYNAIKIMKGVLKKNYSVEVLSILVDFTLKDGDLLSWKNYSEKMVELVPDSPTYLVNISDVYLELQQYSEAEHYMRQALKTAPSYGPYWARLGKIFRHAKQNEKAIEAYQKALLYEKNDYNSHDNIRELEDKGSIFDCFKTNDIEQLIADSSTHEDYPDDNSMIILMDKKRVVYPECGSITEHELLIKVFNQEGIEKFQEYGIGYNSYKQRLVIEEGVVIKQDGSRIQGDKNRNQVVFKTLEPDDVIYLKWKLEDYQSGDMLGHFWDVESLSYPIPVQTVRYSLLVPKQIEFQYKTMNIDLKPKITEIEENMLYSWQTNNEDAIEQEYQMPNSKDVGKVLFVSSIPDWQYIADWYKKIATTKTKSSYEITEVVNSLFVDEPDLDQKEKVKRIYEYIIENITYSSVSFRQSAYVPQKARDVLVNRLGDCKDVSALSIAMLKEIGVNAYFVLADTYDYALNKNQLPSIAAFTHCIVAVETDEGLRYLDHTAQNYDYSTIPSSMIDGCCLLIMENQNELIFLPSEYSNTTDVIRYSNMKILSDKSVLINKKSIKTGDLAAGMRRSYRYKNQKKREKRLTEILANEFPAVKLEKLIMNDFDKLTHEVHYEYEYSVEDYITTAGEFYFLKIPWADNKEPSKAISYETREYPIIRWNYANHCREEMIIEIPNDLKPVDLQNKYEFTSFAGEYSLTLQFDGKNLKCTRFLNRKETDIPIDKYKEFKEFYSNIVNIDKMQILLEKK